MKKSWIYTCFLILLTICAAAGWGWYVLFTPTITNPAGVVYNLKPGSKKQLVVDELTQQGVLKYPSIFSAYIYPQVDAHLKAGEYLFPKGSTLASIWKQIITGRGQVIHAFTIIPGNSFPQVKQLLAQTKELHHLSATMNDQQIMAYLGVPNIAPEGMFFPDTYYYTKGVADIVILKRAFVLMQKKLNAAWEEKANDLPYHTSYEALIAASLIEKEAYLSTERPIIAGVIVNRLQKGMLLQIDPTVIYGMGSLYLGKIHRENLLADTPYNTYVHKGLPPTPIAMPSMASIQAALHPMLHDFYYFVAKGDGSHQFSATLPEHHQAVETAIKIKPITMPPVIVPPVVQQPKVTKPISAKRKLDSKKLALSSTQQSHKHKSLHHSKRAE
ncbi:MAG: endolytic transglycosylase MltG [Gammaproteobacteria bacterium]